MDTDRLIALIVEAVLEELERQGVLHGECHTADVLNTPKEQNAVSVSDKHVISEATVLESAKSGSLVLEVARDALITPLANDTAKERRVTIRRRDS